MASNGDELGKALQDKIASLVAQAKAEGAVEATANGQILDSAMHVVWLNSHWRWLTQNMTTDEREAAAAAVQRYATSIDPGAGPIGDEDLRWWRC